MNLLEPVEPLEPARTDWNPSEPGSSALVPCVNRRRFAAVAEEDQHCVPPRRRRRRPGAPIEPGGRRQRERRGNRSERHVPRRRHVTRNSAIAIAVASGVKHGKDAGRHRHALAAVEPQPHRINVPDDRRGARQSRHAAATSGRMGEATAAAPFATSSAMTTSARPMPVLRSTLAAPTLRLPTRRTSMPHGGRAETQTEPTRPGSQQGC